MATQKNILSLQQATWIAQHHHTADEKLLAAADVLVSWAKLDLAERVLERLRSNPGLSGSANRLAAAARQLRRSGVLNDLAAMPRLGGEGGSNEAFLARNPAGSSKVIIVFTGLALRFWLSLMVLHSFLKRLDTHIIYLADLRQLLYFDGLGSIAKGYDGLLVALRERTRSLGITDIHVMANSAGGFAALRYAMDLQAKSFLGISIRTDLSDQSPLPTGAYFKRKVLRNAAPHMFVDMKPLLAKSRWPERIILYCGEKNPIDPHHAQHLADLPNVEITMLKDDSSHDVIPALLAQGAFEQVLRDFVGLPMPHYAVAER